ncbi:MAG: hypothetical protein ACOVP7_05620 [Lacibacter sp.]
MHNFNLSVYCWVELVSLEVPDEEGGGGSNSMRMGGEVSSSY